MQGIEEIPEWLSDAWLIDEAVAQVILSIVVIFSILLPVMYLSKGKTPALYMIFAFLAECLLVGIGWMPFWILIATVAVMAIAIAMLSADVVLGTGGD